MAMPFTTPLSTQEPADAKPGPAPMAEPSPEGIPRAAQGLQEAPPSKRPHTLWQKIKHSFDYGNSGGQG